jgi:hypothetical protein
MRVWQVLVIFYDIFWSYFLVIFFGQCDHARSIVMYVLISMCRHKALREQFDLHLGSVRAEFAKPCEGRDP